MSPKKPVLATPIKREKRPALGEPIVPKRWTFGFSFFKQIKYFGFDSIDTKWFSSLFDRLRLLSNETVDGFLSDGSKRDQWRYHDVNWAATAIPISRKNLDWLPEEIQNNSEDYPMQQFQVSTGLGRIVGYFDSEQVFQIVLLDPLHNLNPSKDHNYRVTRSLPLNCQYTHLREGVIKAAIEAKCVDGTCPVRETLAGLDVRPKSDTNVVIMKPSDELVIAANELIAKEKAESYSEIFEAGILWYMESSQENSN